MEEPANEAERFTFRLCRQSFLSLWSYANPRGKGGKELCDVLVVSDPDIVIFSVKDIAIADGPADSVDASRWRRRAIEASCKQLYGAERWLASATRVVRSDGTAGLSLPDRERRRIHRVAVALGADRTVSFEMGEFGKGFVHVFDEIGLDIVMRELDTIADFVAYLREKEDHHGQTLTVVEGGEENLLAVYLQNGRSIPGDTDIRVVPADLWSTFVRKPEYQRKQSADADSYQWDFLVETVARDSIAGNLELGSTLDDGERAVRAMARETRLSRRVLGRNFKDFLQRSHKLGARMLRSHQGTVYVFLASPRSTSRQDRRTELQLRMFVGRGRHASATEVVGIATERYKPNQGFSLDIGYLYMPTWNEDDETKLRAIQRDLGYFRDPRETRYQEDEYPEPD